MAVRAEGRYAESLMLSLSWNRMGANYYMKQLELSSSSGSKLASERYLSLYHTYGLRYHASLLQAVRSRCSRNHVQFTPRSYRCWHSLSIRSRTVPWFQFRRTHSSNTINSSRYQQIVAPCHNSSSTPMILDRVDSSRQRTLTELG